MRLFHPLSLALCFVLQSSANRIRIGQQESAHNTAFHDTLLKQLAHSRNSTTLVDDSDLFLTSNSLTGPISLLATTGLQVYLNSTVPTPTPPQACVNALTASVNCNSTISFMPVDPFLLNDNADLQTVCTSTCTQSLASYRSNVVSSCGTFAIKSNNVTYPPTYAVDKIIGAYTVQCLQDPTTHAFCGPAFAPLNATGGLLSLPTSQLCTFCTLKTLNATLSNPATYSAPLAAILKSAVTTCGSAFSNFSVTTAPPPVVTTGLGSLFGQNSTHNAPAADCAVAGRNTTVSSNSTCTQVATQFSITEADILASNPTLNSDCSIASGTKLCLPQACHTYAIKTNDTCDSVVLVAGTMTGTNITTTQLLSFNPELGTFCQAMPNRVGLLICLTPNGGFPNVGAPSNAAVPSATPTTKAAIPSPTPDGTTSKCGKYYQVQEGDICNSVVLKNTVSLPDFLTINPEINVNCTNLWLGYFYCVAPFPPLTTTDSVTTITTNFSSALGTSTFAFPTSFTPTASIAILTPPGVPAPTNVAAGTRTVACGYYYRIASGDTLSSISTNYNMNSSALITWNPELATALPAVGSAICVRFPVGNYTLAPAPTPSNLAPNTTAKTCAQFYTVKSGDGCTSITSNFSLTTTQFLSINAGLNPQCTNLVVGLAYCVFPTTPFSSAASSGPPSNVAAGTITSGCTQYYTVASGDSCGTIESVFNLTSSQFIAFNPEINSQCTNILLGEAYCVKSSNATTPVTGPPANVAAGTITTGCTQYYTVVSGDSCGTIDTKFNLTLAQFITFNPEVNSQCTNIQLGSAYCVQSSNSTTTGPPSNVASGTITSGCTQYYTVVSGDSCATVESKFNLTLAQFITFNPEINSQCTNIQLGLAYCVHSSNSTTTPVGPPANLASGSLNNCTSYYTIVSGDNCPAIETNFTIAASDFFRWNPEVNTACTNIAVGEAYCVKGGPSACKKTYTVKSGDFCSGIVSSQGITQTQLNTLNPQLDANCDLSVGEILCVG
ncbi:hypothetical protein D9619_009152 [Psilocybe cf. subviscida]|uniref:LysM domain-containing protein n=1 Tax=Psilocybe cf. subviscida TaxID=2480587 RepID=A0A8H5FAG9_9AGAR|nr:hypothetical protein D9619_009152 [Psilocybe cf. subviscida]